MISHQLPRDIISNVLQIAFIIEQRSRKRFNLLIVLGYIFNNFVTLAKSKVNTEIDADALKHGALTIYKMLFIYIYICYASR
jgi:hypothetical protein